MARRTGIPTLIDVAMMLCKYITKYGGLITTLYPSNTALAAALAAANAACATLHTELMMVRDTGD